MDEKVTFHDGPAVETHLDASGKAVLGYWHALKGERPYPRKSEFDPIEVPSALPGIQIVESVPGPDEFRYRLIGTREVDARGWNPVGLPVSEGFIGSSAEQVLINYRRLMELSVPFCVTGVFRKNNGVWIEDVSLFLPMADDSDELKYAFVYSYQRPPPEPTGDRN